jgi:poly-gamma-glutamate synthesis protein (capsule biosynthesis protein)
MELSLTPYTNRITTGMWRRKLLPSFLSKNRINNLNNKIVCESHRDVMINYLNFKYIDNNE